MPEVLRGAVVAGATLVAPTPVWDEVTAAAVAAERADAEQQGYARGVADGRAAAMAELARVSTAVTAALDALTAEVVAQREAAIAVDLDLVRATVAAVLDDAPPTSAGTLLERIGEAAAMLDDATLEVRLHPDDLTVIADAARDPRLELVADPGVDLGEATVTGTWGRADLRRERLRDVALAQLHPGGDAATAVGPEVDA